MTQTLGDSDDSGYPTSWHRIDDHLGISTRQISEDTFQLIDESTIYTVNKEGFNIFRSNPFPVFKQWCWDNKIKDHHDGN